MSDTKKQPPATNESKFTYDKPVNKKTDRTISKSVINRLNKQHKAKDSDSNMVDEANDYRRSHFKRRTP